MAGTTQPSQATKDEVELRELIARWSKAVRDEDLTAIRADHDPKILMFDVPPPFLSRGIDAYMATWQTFFASSATPVVFDFADVQLTPAAKIENWPDRSQQCPFREPPRTFWQFLRVQS